MDRRHFLSLALGAGAAAYIPLARAQSRQGGEPGGRAMPDYRRLLVLVELKGGNDGLNTVVPHADPLYMQLRPHLALKRDNLLPLDERTGLHPSLQSLLPLWQGNELAVVQGVGYPSPNLSHFRSIEIWDTASRTDEYLHDGWLARSFARYPAPSGFLADAVAVGSQDMGPLTGTSARTLALSNPEQFLRQSRQLNPAPGVSPGGNRALAHLTKVEADVLAASLRLDPNHAFRTDFPAGPFGQAVHTGCQAIASGAGQNPSGGGIAALRLTLNGFDTHQNQAGTHANLLQQLADGLLALRSALTELGRWQDTLVLTYAEFGRRPQENQSNGTDHGTAAPHFVLGGRVRGGLYGAPPALDRLDGNGNLPFAVDFRQLYATALEGWWGIPAADLLGGKFTPLPLLRI